ncbi:MAG TPA: 16S rRNA (cytidine(1402)-2'-O)-methyltransferase [Egibacteraceae bacterium]|nr:16S rRNA (cytidine(1402)-2'-O)-methyltransferase [Egibacteraceae bacterium]
MGGRVILVGTPIGNLEDLSPRAVKALAAADVIAVEDTRRSRILLDHAGVRTPMVSYHDHNEIARTPELLDRVEAGQTVVLVTDAGTPGLADPGYRLVRAAVDRGLPVESVPGPAAAIQALVVSGLPMDRFSFEGFLPRKAGARAQVLAGLADDPRTLVFYVTPHRAAADLEAMAEAFGERQAALARELTKRHEEVWRGSLLELAARASGGVRGELTLVVAGAPSGIPRDVDAVELAERVRSLIAAGDDKKRAVARVAEATGAPRREVYQAVLDAGGRPSP